MSELAGRLAPHVVAEALDSAESDEHRAHLVAEIKAGRFATTVLDGGIIEVDIGAPYDEDGLLLYTVVDPDIHVDAAIEELDGNV